MISVKDSYHFFRVHENQAVRIEALPNTVESLHHEKTVYAYVHEKTMGNEVQLFMAEDDKMPALNGLGIKHARSYLVAHKSYT